jgi:hypothetical protein
MVFRDVLGVKACTIEGFDDFQSLLVEILQRQMVAIQVIEDPELQSHLLDRH